MFPVHTVRIVGGVLFFAVGLVSPRSSANDGPEFAAGASGVAASDAAASDAAGSDAADASAAAFRSRHSRRLTPGGGPSEKGRFMLPP